MKIEQIKPIRFSSDGRGLVDVVYWKRHGFLWLRKTMVIRRAMSVTGVYWRWVDSPNSELRDLSDIIWGNIPELEKGVILNIEDGRPV